jgi:hypothetical protein
MDAPLHKIAACMAGAVEFLRSRGFDVDPT